MTEQSSAAHAIDLANAEYQQLIQLERGLQLYEERKRELMGELGQDAHKSIVGPLIEVPLREYFKEVLPGNMLVGEGFPVATGRQGRHPAQIDLVMDFDNARWHRSSEANSHHGGEPVYAAAMEARYRGPHLRERGPRSVAASAMEVVERLQYIVDESVRAKRKCWTSAVLLGPGHRTYGLESNDLTACAINPVLRAVLEGLADFYSRRALLPASLPGVPKSWPFVDAIAMPGVLIKKHTLFEAPHVDSPEHPVLVVQPFAMTDAVAELRPLATLKGHLKHVLACIGAGRSFEAPAWDEHESLRFLGPRPCLRECLSHHRAVVLDRFDGNLYHAGWNQEARRVEWQHFVADPLVGNPVRVPELLLG